VIRTDNGDVRLSGTPIVQIDQQRKWLTRLPLALAIALCAVYLVLSMVAAFAYPGSFEPLHHWLSDLGNRRLNPAGAIWYRTASVAGGILMGATFLALDPWKPARGSRLLAFEAMEVLGLIAGLGFLMTGIYPEDIDALHRDWSRVIFAAFIAAAVVSLYGLPRKVSRRVGLDASVAACLVSGSLYGAIGATWLEWSTVGCFLCFGLLLGTDVAAMPQAFRGIRREDAGAGAASTLTLRCPRNEVGGG
jgi:hypothetical membrane protein